MVITGRYLSAIHADLIVDDEPLLFHTGLVGTRHRSNHRSCAEALNKIREPLGTVWPAFTEAMYLVSDFAEAREALWEMLARNVLQLLPLTINDVSRMRELMRKYAARPLGSWKCGGSKSQLSIPSRPNHRWIGSRAPNPGCAQLAGRIETADRNEVTAQEKRAATGISIFGRTSKRRISPLL
jgi:RNAse (barnase) inhibitor barstar